jgi:uncharacterized protein
MTVPETAGDDLQSRLRAALGAALRARDLTAAAALRSALGAIGNAEAVPVPAPAAPPAARPPAPAPADLRAAARSPHIAGAAAGLGAAEAERRRLTPGQVAAIVQAEIDERLAAATQYESAGHAGRAARLRSEAQALTSAARCAPEADRHRPPGRRTPE